MSSWGDSGDNWTSKSNDDFGGGGGGSTFSSERRNSSSFSSRPSNYSSNQPSSFGTAKKALDVSSTLKIEKLGLDTSITEIRHIFGRFGKVSRVVVDYSITDNRVTCFLDYENPECASTAIKKVDKREFRGREVSVVENSSGGSGVSGGFSSSLNEMNPIGPSRQSRGGGAGGGGGGNICYRCQQPGHFARECPNSSEDTRNGSRGGFRGRGRGRGGGNGGDRYQPYSRDGGSGFGSNDNAASGSGGGGNDWGSSSAGTGGGGGWGDTPTASTSASTPKSTSSWGDTPAATTTAASDDWGDTPAATSDPNAGLADTAATPGASQSPMDESSSKQSNTPSANDDWDAPTQSVSAPAVASQSMDTSEPPKEDDPWA